MKILTCNKHPQHSLKLIDDKIIIEASSRMKIYPILKTLFFKDSSENTLTISMNIFKSNLKNISDKLGLDSEELKDFLSIEEKEVLTEHPHLNEQISQLKANLYPYQKDAINYALNYNYCIIGAAIGLGKSLISIGITINCKKTIVIVPASLKDNYKKEVEKFTDKKAIVIKNWKDCDKVKDESIIIINYEIIEKCSKIFEGCDSIVCDEIQKANNSMSKMGKALFSKVLLHKPKYFIGLSGTPISGKVPQFFQLLRYCSLNSNDCGIKLQEDKRYNIAFRFAQFFSHEKSNGFGSVFYGLKNYPELKKLLKKKYVRYTVEEHLPQMPDIIRQQIEIQSSFESENEKQLLEAFNSKEKGQSLTGELSTIKRLHAESKVNGTYDFILELLDSEEKVIVFSDHKLPIEKLQEKFLESGIKTSVVSGDIKMVERQKDVDLFQEGDSRVFLATIPTASAGFTLTSSSVVIFNDISWNPIDIIQCEGRARRIGQKKTVRAFYMVSDKVDKIILNTITSKIKIMNTVLSEGKEATFKVDSLK